VKRGKPGYFCSTIFSYFFAWAFQNFLGIWCFNSGRALTNFHPLPMVELQALIAEGWF
jgi:hypothetical protein